MPLQAVEPVAVAVVALPAGTRRTDTGRHRKAGRRFQEAVAEAVRTAEEQAIPEIQFGVEANIPLAQLAAQVGGARADAQAGLFLGRGRGAQHGAVHGNVAVGRKRGGRARAQQQGDGEEQGAGLHEVGSFRW
jgi:hypothetical protein